ncbi:MAG: acetate kinase [Gammaproteobacteria bacterium]|nr:acetate kinase [Gammaproteobacteria bacterium]
MKILVINCGSSSIKYELFNMEEHTVLTSGVLERIGESNSKLKHKWRTVGSRLDEKIYEQKIKDHQQAFDLIHRAMRESKVMKDLSELAAVGHRVVHGGEAFKQPALIDDTVLEGVRKVTPLAPLHNPANLTGIEIAMKIMPNIPHVAVFDTAFHQTIPEYAFRYALPEDLYQSHGVRRYGFHGTSHYYVAKQAAHHLNESLHSLNLITLHLGNGASAAAIRQGECMDTSMGLTPLEGLIMGTRSGDIDPAIPFYLAKQTHLSFADIDNLLNKQSGLKGICGYNDMREIHLQAQNGNSSAQLAIEMYCYRIKKYLGAYCAVLGRVDAIVFTAGIGENADFIREKVCDGLDGLGICLDTEKNQWLGSDCTDISTAGSPVKILVVPTDEEWEIAQQTLSLVVSG